MSTSPTPPTMPPSLVERDALREAHAFMAHRTESGDQPWSKYKLSDAGQDSGYSFGQIQIDLANKDNAYRARLIAEAGPWLVKNKKIDPKDEGVWKNSVDQQLFKKTSARALTKDNRALLDSFLMSAEGQKFVDEMSEVAFDNLIMPRLRKFFSNPSARILIKDPQFIAYAAKIANAGNGNELQDFLTGKRVKLGGKPEMPEGRSKQIDGSALTEEFSGALKQSATVMIGKEAIVLVAGASISVSKAGLFLDGSRNKSITLLNDSLRLTIPDSKDTRPQFTEDNLPKGIDTNPQDKAEVVISKKEQKGNSSGVSLDFKNASVFQYKAVQISAAQASGEKAFFPGEFFQLYANNNVFTEPYEKARNDIYFKRPWQYQMAATRPEVLAEVDRELWKPLDPKGILLPNLRKVIQEEHAAENQALVNRKQEPRPLTSELIREYMTGNQRVMAEAIRTQPPEPGKTETQLIYYPNSKGEKAQIIYKVRPELMEKGQVGLARALAEQRYWDIGVAPSDSKYPIPYFDPNPPKRYSGEQASLVEKPSNVIFKGDPVVPQTPVVLAMAPLALPTAGGPAPFARPAGPSTAEQLAQAVDEQRAAEVAAFEEEERLAKLVRAEIRNYARRPRHGWTPAEEAALCGVTIHRPGGYRHRDFGDLFA